jgi:5-methylcytosine-specific restriction endonuclease McrA
MTPERVEARQNRRKARRDANIEAERARRQAVYAADGTRERANAQQRRAAKRAVPCEDFTDREIYDRDGWRCGICGEGIDAALRWPEPFSVSLDHIVPLARGGSHTRDNVQAAHLRCNMRKHAALPAGRLPDQASQ